QRVTINTGVALDQMKGAAGFHERRLVGEVRDIHDERRAFPPASRIPHQTARRGGDMRTSVERDDPRLVQALVQERYLVPGLDNLETVAVLAGIPGGGQPARNAPVEEIQVFGA